MPFYDLHCENCDREFNIMASITDKSERRISCPECGSTDMQTIYKSPPAYIKSRGEKVPACPNGAACGAGCQNIHKVL